MCAAKSRINSSCRWWHTGGKRARFFSDLSLSLFLSVAAWNAVGNEIRRPSVRRGPRTSSISANIQAFRCEGERWKFYDVWGGGGVSLRKGYAVGGRPSIVSGRAAIRMSLIRRGGGGPARANVDDTNRSMPPPPPPPSRVSACAAALRSRRDKYTADAGVVSIRETQPTWGHLSRYDREYIQETSS